MRNCFFIIPGPVTPEKVAAYNRFFHLGQKLRGHVIQSSWNVSPELIKDLDAVVPSFKFHLLQWPANPSFFASLKDMVSFVLCGLRTYWGGDKFEAVICYGLTKTAIAAYIIKLFTGAKMILEVPCNPKQAFIAEEQNPSFTTKVKSRIAQNLIQFLFKRVDCLRYLYPDQIVGYEIGPQVIKKVFAEFIPVSSLEKSNTDENFIILLGYPWYRKGVDVLLNAFNQISAEFPDIKLKVMGWILPEEQSYLRNTFCNVNERVEFLKPTNWEGAMETVAKAKFMVLPSRSEAMGRVWLEAMALGKPVICAAVDGIPHYVKHEKNGLLFKSENVDELANCMRRLLKDNALFEALADGGLSYAHKELNEDNYVRDFCAMVDEVCATGKEKGNGRK